MKTGLGIYTKYRKLLAYCNLLRFTFRKRFIGFDVANQFLQRVDKYSVILILKRNGASIGENCKIETGLVFHNCNDYKNLIVGNNCHIGKNCFLDLKGKILIGDNVVISMQTTIITHQELNKSELSKQYPPSVDDVTIGSNCYIGVSSVITKGVVIYDSSIIAAGSVVIRNVEAGTIFGGVPAKQIGMIK